MHTHITRGLAVIIFLTGLSAAAFAQSAQPEERFSAEFGLGWDNGISGNINSSGIGTLNNQTVVILKNKYEDVYGTGLHMRFGGGYMFKENSELRVTFSLQSLDADLVPMGDLGVSNLYGQYADYQSFGMDFGYRRYVPVEGSIRTYAEATIGLAFIDETDVVLTAPGGNFTGTATDFYDRTSAFTMGFNVGVLFGVMSKADVFTQIGLRYVTGMSDVDQLAATGLETINDKSSRWAMPFVSGVRFRF